MFCPQIKLCLFMLLPYFETVNLIEFASLLMCIYFV